MPTEVSEATTVSHCEPARLFERAPVGYCLIDPAGLVLECNARVPRLLGQQRESLLGSRFAALVGPEHQSRLADFFAGLRPGAEAAVVALRMLCADGTGSWQQLIAERDPDQSIRLVMHPVCLSSPPERELCEIGECQRLLLDNAPAVMYLCGIDGHFGATFITGNVETMLGYRASEFVAQPDFWIRRIHPEDRAQVLAKLPLTVPGPVLEQEYRFLHADGSYRWLHDHIRLLPEVPGTAPQMIGSMLDITARKRVEQSLRASESRWQFAIHGAGDGLWDWDLESGVVFYSTYWKKMLGHAEHEIGDSPEEWRSRVHPQDLPAVMVELEAQLAGRNELYLSEHRMLCKQGHWIWTLDRGMVVARDAQGRPLRMIGTHKDISARKQTEVALRESEQRFRTIFESSPECIKVLSAEGRLLQMNPAGLAMLEAESVAQVCAFGLHNFIVPACQPAFAALFGSAVKGGSGTLNFEVVGLRGTRRWLQTHTTPMPDPDGSIRMVLGLTRDVTAAQRVQASLENTTEMLVRAGQMARIGGWTLDLEGMQMFWSDETCRIHGLEPPVTPTLAQAIAFYPQPARDSIRAALQEAMTEGTPWDLELPLIAADGHQLWVRVQGSAVLEAGRPVKLVGAMQEITARRNAEAAMRVTDVALKSVSQGVLITDARRQIMSANHAFVAITGFTEAEVMGRTCKFLQGPLTDPRVIDSIRERLNAQREFAGEILNYRKDGSQFWNDLTISPVIDELGQVSHYIGVTRDVTQRRQAEMVLRDRELQMRLALRAGNLGLWDWDAASGQLVVNERWMQMLGLDPQGPAPTIDFWHSLVHPEDMPKLQRLIDEVILDPHGTHLEAEIRARHSDGRWIWIHDIGNVVGRDPDCQPLRVIGTHMDITQRKQAEAALRLSLDEKVALLNEVHHRVKNNLQVVTSLLRLETGRSALADTKAVLTEMQGRIRSMALLHESLYRSATFSAVNLGNYLKQLATEAFRSLAPQSGLVKLQLDLAPVEVGMDQATPCGLLVNELLSNCLKHAFPEGRTGTVLITLQPAAEGREFCLRVKDDGVGLPADFELRRKHSLGLQLVYDLARQLAGTLTISDGPGADFSLAFVPDIPAANARK